MQTSCLVAGKPAEQLAHKWSQAGAMGCVKMMNFVSKMMNCVLKTSNHVFKMKNFVHNTINAYINLQTDRHKL